MTFNRNPSITMKLYSLLSAVVLGMAVPVHAQEKSVLPAPKAAGVAQDTNMNADGSVTLSSGRLVDVVAEIERRIGHWTKSEGGGKPAMPNIFNGLDTREAVVPGDLRLRDVSPLEAVAFAAAAAGCTLEPIFAPKDAPEAAGQKVIGYRIVPGLPQARQYTPIATQATGRGAQSLSEVGLALAKNDGGIVVGQIVPESPASSSSAIKPGQRILSVAEAGQPDVDVTGLQLEQVVQLIRGAPGTPVKITFGADSDKGPTKHVVTLVREKLPVRTAEPVMPKVRVVNSGAGDYGASSLGGGGGMAAAEGRSATKPGTTSSRLPSTRSAHANDPFVRVYAIGFIMTGTEQEKVTKMHTVEELIKQALNAAKLDLNPDLNIHFRTGTLISKATAAQHEIIDQVVQALKENAAQLAAPAKP